MSRLHSLAALAGGIIAGPLELGWAQPWRWQSRSSGVGHMVLRERGAHCGIPHGRNIRESCAKCHSSHILTHESPTQAASAHAKWQDDRLHFVRFYGSSVVALSSEWISHVKEPIEAFSYTFHPGYFVSSTIASEARETTSRLHEQVPNASPTDPTASRAEDGRDIVRERAWGRRRGSRAPRVGRSAENFTSRCSSLL